MEATFGVNQTTPIDGNFFWQGGDLTAKDVPTQSRAMQLIDAFLKKIIDPTQDPWYNRAGPLKALVINNGPARSNDFAFSIAMNISSESKLSGDERVEYHQLLLEIAHELGHPDAAFFLAKSHSKANNPKKVLEWYGKVPEGSKHHQEANKRLSLTRQVEAILGKHYVHTWTPEQNLTRAIKKGDIPTHDIEISDVCFSFGKSTTVYLPKNITLVNCTVRSGSVAFCRGKAGAINSESKVVSVTPNAFGCATTPDAVADSSEDGITISGDDYPYVVDIIVNFSNQESKERRADNFYAMAMRLKENNRNEGAIQLLDIAHDLGHPNAAYALALHLMQSDIKPNIDEVQRWQNKIGDATPHHALIADMYDSYLTVRKLLDVGYRPDLSFSENVCNALINNSFATHGKITLFNLKLILPNRLITVSHNVTLHNCKLCTGILEFDSGVLIVTGTNAMGRSGAWNALACATVKGATTHGKVRINYDDYLLVKDELTTFITDTEKDSDRADAAHGVACILKATNGNYRIFRYMCEAAHRLKHPEAMHDLANVTMALADYHTAIDYFEKVPDGNPIVYQEAQAMVAASKASKHTLKNIFFRIQDPYADNNKPVKRHMPAHVDLQGCIVVSGYGRLKFHQGNLCVTVSTVKVNVDGENGVVVGGTSGVRMTAAEGDTFFSTVARVIAYDESSKIESFATFWDPTKSEAERAKAVCDVGNVYRTGAIVGEGKVTIKQSNTLSRHFFDCALHLGHKEANYFAWQLCKGVGKYKGEARIYARQVMGAVELASYHQEVGHWIIEDSTSTLGSLLGKISSKEDGIN